MPIYYHDLGHLGHSIHPIPPERDNTSAPFMHEMCYCCFNISAINRCFTIFTATISSVDFLLLCLGLFKELLLSLPWPEDDLASPGPRSNPVGPELGRQKCELISIQLWWYCMGWGDWRLINTTYRPKTASSYLIYVSMVCKIHKNSQYGTRSAQFYLDVQLRLN